MQYGLRAWALPAFSCSGRGPLAILERNARQARRPIPVSDPNSTTNIHPSGAMLPPKAISRAPTTLKLAVPSEKAAVLRMLGINMSRSG